MKANPGPWYINEVRRGAVSLGPWNLGYEQPRLLLAERGLVCVVLPGRVVLLSLCEEQQEVGRLKVPRDSDLLVALLLADGRVADELIRIPPQLLGAAHLGPRRGLHEPAGLKGWKKVGGSQCLDESDNLSEAGLGVVLQLKRTTVPASMPFASANPPFVSITQLAGAVGW